MNPLVLGDAVKVISGDYLGFYGEVSELKEAGIITIKRQNSNGETLVNVHFSDVEKTN